MDRSDSALRAQSDVMLDLRQTLGRFARRTLARGFTCLHKNPLEAHLASTPLTPLITDVYLVSYPKSGSTWLAFLIANVNLLMSGEFGRRATFFNLHDHVPDVQISRDIPKPIHQFPGFRIIKTHSDYNPLYHKVLFLVRHPVDVIVSLHQYLTELNLTSYDIKTFLRDGEVGIGSWVAHTLGWLDKVNPSFSACALFLIKYEELLNNTKETLREIYRAMGIEVTDAVLDEAIQRSSIAAMRADEARLNARHPSRGGFEFVRKTALGGPRTLTDENVSREIIQLSGVALQRLGYV